MLLIRVKVENPSAHELSGTEVSLFNLYTFGICSRSASHYHRWKKDIDQQVVGSRSTGTGGGIGSGSVVELPVTGTKNGCSVSTQETQEQDENI